MIRPRRWLVAKGQVACAKENKRGARGGGGWRSAMRHAGGDFRILQEI